MGAACVLVEGFVGGGGVGVERLASGDWCELVVGTVEEVVGVFDLIEVGACVLDCANEFGTGACGYFSVVDFWVGFVGL